MGKGHECRDLSLCSLFWDIAGTAALHPLQSLPASRLSPATLSTGPPPAVATWAPPSSPSEQALSLSCDLLTSQLEALGRLFVFKCCYAVSSPTPVSLTTGASTVGPPRDAEGAASPDHTAPTFCEVSAACTPAAWSLNTHCPAAVLGAELPPVPWTHQPACGWSLSLAPTSVRHVQRLLPGGGIALLFFPPLSLLPLIPLLLPSYHRY